MKLIHRIAYYSVGLFFGIILLMFFLAGKKTSCDYSPDARVLKNIRIKERKFSPEAQAFFEQKNIDTSIVSTILNNGDINFSKSDTEGDPCNVYFVTGTSNDQDLEMLFENCDSIATLQSIRFSE